MWHAAKPTENRRYRGNRRCLSSDLVLAPSFVWSQNVCFFCSSALGKEFPERRRTCVCKEACLLHVSRLLYCEEPLNVPWYMAFLQGDFGTIILMLLVRTIFCEDVFGGWPIGALQASPPPSSRPCRWAAGSARCGWIASATRWR